MAPIPRCDLRLPNESRGIRRVSAPAVTKKPITISVTTPTPTVVVDETEDEIVDDSVPKPAHSRHQRDSAQIIEDAAEFSTSLTRDQGEILSPENVPETSVDDVCAALEKCRAPPDETGDDDGPPETHSDEIDHHATATPGDVCAQFCRDRAESPSCDMRQLRFGGGKKTSIKLTAEKKAVTCKGTYSSRETYTLFWGSSRAIGARKKLELEMKKRRKFLEKLHEHNRRRREKERHRAKEKRRMLRCRDQAKIPETKDDISINKAFYFRFNYNKQLPFMPSTMDQHFKKYNKPPFKIHHSKHKRCNKHVDEFQKLRVTEEQITEMAESKKKVKDKGLSTRKQAAKAIKAAKVTKKMRH